MDPTSHDARRQLAANLALVRERMALAATRAGRAPEEVRLIGVTKYVNVEFTRMLREAGCTDLGESRPQSLWEKAEGLFGTDTSWHLIGHLQRNKVRKTLPYVSMIHSIDSLRLLKEIDTEAREQKRTIQGLIEVNISGDAAKHGVAPDELEGFLASVADITNVSIVGLMGMAGLDSDWAQSQREFASLRELGERVAPRLPSNVHLTELSMGMSGDFEQAIAEGATLVRIGSTLWEGIDLSGASA
jgi:pyridoxal phosphate enzyme (YggS family)